MSARLEAILARLKGVRPSTTGQWMALCPLHDDSRPSLSVAASEDRKILIFCHRCGGVAEQVMDAIGLPRSMLFPDNGRQPETTSRRRGQIVKTYDYVDAEGELLFQVCRLDPKGFRQRRPDPNRPGHWVWSLDGVQRVLYRLPQLLRCDLGQWVFIVEGERDVDNLVDMGLCATTSPQGAGSWEKTDHEPLRNRKVCIIPDNDMAGARHAGAVRWTLKEMASQVVIVELPGLGDHEDVTDWINRGGSSRELSALIRKALCDGAGAMSTADRIVELAIQRFRMGRTAADEPFAVAKEGANIARILRGGRDSLRAELAAAHRQRYERTPSTTALANAMLVLEGMAAGANAEPVHLRVAERGNAVVLDLGTSDGRALVIQPEGWQTVDRSPVLFRRTELTGALPEPVRGADGLEQLRMLLNVTSESWPLIVGWLVSLLLPDLPHPITLLAGQQGSGKSSAAAMLASITDPSPAVLRTPPRDLEQWAVSAAGSWVVAIDNVSAISPWFSDALCRASTGDGMIRRRLYSDSGLSVLSFRRCVVLTSIDPGALRGDLGDRLLAIDLDPIPSSKRRLDRDMRERFAAARGAILGSLCDLASNVLRELPSIELPGLPRLADFAKVLAAVDKVTGMNACELFVGQAVRVAEDVVESDAVAIQVRDYVLGRGNWSGTAKQLLDCLTPEDKAPKGWPASPRGLSGRLRRLIPALAAVGVTVTPPAGQTGVRRERIWRLEVECEQSSQPVNGSHDGPQDPAGHE